MAYAVVRAQRAPNDANKMILRREAGRGQFDEDIEQEKATVREASLVEERAQQALDQSVSSAAAGATAAPSPSTHSHGVASQRPRPGDSALFQGQRRVHGVCTEGRILPSIGDRDGANGLRPHRVREVSVVASGRPFSGSGLDSHGLYALCEIDESRLNTCPCHSRADSRRRAPRARLVVEPRTKSWQNATGENSDAPTVTTAGTASVGMASILVGVATTTTAAGVTTAVGEGEAHRVLVWLRAPFSGQLWSQNRDSWPQL